ncbi:putative parvulin-type peptidyl-prolyl cis-trans isomerase [Usitatibacter rugosus]|uniref:peptidylprolyl isomerase n=1 Tax=Usitatibacter rugosus TaxID=2732067 RepID=A0A6M4GS77_9PROT|nr:peptidylprolyl isomerase [Usitatibacter rugosus]QJR09915.1 putative parvulin-type peptidyl-prolyl cis-trans isomerase [Usitatibacter rugosus]
MQPTFRNLAVALAAGTIALAAVAQDKAEKAPKKSTTAAAAPAAGGRVVVNGVVIPQSRIDAMNKELSAQGQPDTPERLAAVKDELVNREVLAQAAVKRGLDKNPDVAAQMEMARQAVLVRALFENEMKANPITDADLQKQYETFKSQMGTNEYKVRHILVEKEDDAKAIIADLNKGGDFSKIAKDKSKDPGSKDNGGDLDWGPAARYVKPFADTVMKLPKGQTTTAPVKTDFGYHVIRVDDVRPLKVPEFAELKEQFRQRAQQAQVQKLVADLRSKAKVEER